MTGHKRHSPRSHRRAVTAAATAAAAALLLSACGSDSDSGNPASGSGANFVTSDSGIATVAAGDRHAAPRLQGKTLDGGQLDTADYRGKVVVLNVWGSWCAPCRAEAKNFVKVAEETEDQGVQFVGINTRDTSTQPALAFEKEEGIEYPSLYDPTGRLLLRFEKGTLNPQAIPTTLIIDRDGRIAARAMQPLSEEKLRGMLDPVLAEK
ncbi:TlpA family protein disulfide reductase [Streptomyces abyssomicinicus]|uniref:TlpA family protein disulfide reductase n=1 Tax=Streptomyces abyssomicinicus TaxID=574929 RepID=UPI0012507E86|nr:TlpA disulfide reductase family protein [Streptomyces abyssomicinicus]